jgi:hypothetical protein
MPPMIAVDHCIGMLTRINSLSSNFHKFTIDATQFEAVFDKFPATSRKLRCHFTLDLPEANASSAYQP